jgi:hypothetical protein
MLYINFIYVDGGYGSLWWDSTSINYSYHNPAGNQTVLWQK